MAEVTQEQEVSQAMTQELRPRQPPAASSDWCGKSDGWGLPQSSKPNTGRIRLRDWDRSVMVNGKIKK